MKPEAVKYTIPSNTLTAASASSGGGGAGPAESAEAERLALERLENAEVADKLFEFYLNL